MKFYLYKKRRAEKVLAMMKEEGGCILVEGSQKMSTKRGVRKVLPCLEGGAKSFEPAIFPFCTPPPSP